LVQHQPETPEEHCRDGELVKVNVLGKESGGRPYAKRFSTVLSYSCFLTRGTLSAISVSNFLRLSGVSVSPSKNSSDAAKISDVPLLWFAVDSLVLDKNGCQVNFRAQWATISPSEVWDSFSLVPSNIHAESRTVVHKTPRQRPLLYTTSQLTSCVIHNEYARRRWTINQKIHQGPFAGQQSDR
jgi:hypothetical protein